MRLQADSEETRNFNSTRFIALAASVLVVVSLSVVYQESYTGVINGTGLTSEVANSQNGTKPDSFVVEQRVANNKQNSLGIENKLVASKQLNNELNLIKSDFDKLAKRIASL